MRPLEFDFTSKKPSKTLDIGLNGASISADPLGRVLQLSCFHPEHGIIVAAPYEQFDGNRFYEPKYVRAYRARMLKMIQLGRPGFGLRFEGRPSHVSIEICDLNKALVRYQLREDVAVTVCLEVNETGSATQSATFTSTAAEITQIKYILDLGISVNRASYGQLTEGGPILIPKSENKFVVLDCGRRFVILNSYLGAHLEGCLEIDGAAVELAGLVSETFTSTPVVASFSKSINLPAHGSRSLTTRYRLIPNVDIQENFDMLHTNGLSELSSVPAWVRPENDALFIIRRNLEYILGNCAIPVSDTEVALITDHVALPLGWNRDNYWQVRFLLDVNQNLDRLMYPDAAHRYRLLIQKTVKGHLRWAFCRAQRPFAFWHRSYVVTGRPKDGPVFQLDQQCYPFLEVCDFFDAFPEETTFVRTLLGEKSVSEVIELLKSKRDLVTGLLPTDETPGDDAVEYPYHFSSHVLLWYTLSRLSELEKVIGVNSICHTVDLSSLAKDIQHSTISHFGSANPRTGKSMFAYLVDGGGKVTFYHDANDVPTLFAPVWKFVQSKRELELWRNTLEFALSPLNEQGYYVGEPFGGLGSVHTPGPWPLGYFQEFVFAQMIGDEAAEEDAWRRIRGAMLWDGLFSEAVDYRAAECTSKAWFSWPGSMIGGALLRSDHGRKYLES